LHPCNYPQQNSQKLNLGLNPQAKSDNRSPISTPDYSGNPFLSSAGGKKDCSRKREMVDYSFTKSSEYMKKRVFEFFT
jgi:hypothetical protein